MGNQTSRQKYLESLVGDTTVDDQEPTPDDAGRMRCALYDAAALGRGSGGSRVDDLPMWVLEHPMGRIGHALPIGTGMGFMDVETKDILRPKLEHLRFLILKLGKPNAFQVRTSIAQHIHSSMQLEFEAVSEEDTLKLVAGSKVADSDDAKKVVNMFNLISREYKGMRPVGDIKLSVTKLCEWHTTFFDGIEDFKHKKVGELREAGVSSAGGRAYPARKLAANAIETLCCVINEWAHKEAQRDPQDSVDAMMRIFAVAAFAQYHFVDIHPFLDGNGRMCRYLCKYILESCLPVPFPMYNDRNEYLSALKAGDDACKDDSGGARDAYAPLLHVTIKAATEYYEELLQLGSRPLLIGRTTEDIEQAIKEQRVLCTPEDHEVIKNAFEALDAFASSTIKLSKGSVQITKVVTVKQTEADEVDDDIDIDQI